MPVRDREVVGSNPGSLVKLRRPSVVHARTESTDAEKRTGGNPIPDTNQKIVMKKITKPHEPNDEKFVFTEGINYFKTGKRSIWGYPDKIILEILQKTSIRGKWLNLAAGDGTYNKDLLKKADFVIASDIDESALSKLWYNTPKRYRSKLGTKAFDCTKRFPFNDGSFAGVFCAGVLHLFPREVFRKIFHEIDRILGAAGKVIIQFETDVKRVSTDGKPITFRKSEPLYGLGEAKTFLKNVFKDYSVKIYKTEGSDKEFFSKANPPYTFSSKSILLLADKK